MPLRPYQQKGFDAIRSAHASGVKNVLFVCPTGGGKTVVFSEYIKAFGGPAVAIAHRQELVTQMSLTLARNGVWHRIIGPTKVVKLAVQLHTEELGRSFYSPSAEVAVAGVDTMIRRGDSLRDWLPRVGLWVVDECFPAGTLVDGRPIETLKVGDEVSAFNEVTGRLEPRKVVRLFKNPAPKWMVRLTTSCRSLVCTYGHPIWDGKEWKKAGEFTSGDSLFGVSAGESVPFRSRVDRIEILESADLRDAGHGFVYNIEVEGLHTYTADGVVVHNCHHLAGGNKWCTAVEMLPNAVGLGVTATPLRADGKGLGRHADGVMDCMIEGPSQRALIDQGFLTEYRIFSPDPSIVMDVEAGASGDWSTKQLQAAAKKSRIVGDVVDHYMRIAPGKLGVTFTTDVETATDVADQFSARGVRAEVVSAKTSDWDRVNAIRRFRNRETLQLVNVDLFGEGFDLPAIEVVSMARPTQSYGLYVQQFGRALRLMDGKDRALIIDHVGNVLRHGLPDAPREWSLDRREKRSSAKPSDAIPLRACVECCGVYERIHKACPYCGHEPIPAARNSPEHVDGDLTELDPATLAKMRGEATPQTEEEYSAWLSSRHVPDLGHRRALRLHREKLDALGELRESIAYWAGEQRAAGRPDSQSYRLFYHLFGTDVLSAQAVGTEEARKLKRLIDSNRNTLTA